MDPRDPFSPPSPSSDSTRGGRWSRFQFRFPYAEHPLFHLALFLLSFTSMTAAGALYFSGATTVTAAITRGLLFSVPAILILGTHEMGHFLMCRRYGLAATWPYFLPAPTMFGTLGAVIRIKEPIRRKALLVDVGAAGPIAGFVMTIPFLLYGVMHSSPAAASPPGSETYVFGYPLALRLAQQWTGTAPYTSATVHEHPTLMAAWLGLIVTALNLLPIGQLDGGHVLRAVVGRRQPAVSRIVLLLCFGAALQGGYSWAIFGGIVALVVGITHPPVEDDDERIGTGRLTIALVCLALFLLCATTVPYGPLSDKP